MNQRIDGPDNRYAIRHDLPPASERPNPDTIACLNRWILYLPGDHPAWSYYMVSAISLADFPGVPPAKKLHPESTHEIIVGAINPDYPKENIDTGGVDILRPLNYAEQFTATDDLAHAITTDMVRAFLNRSLLIEPSGYLGARDLFRHILHVVLQNRQIGNSHG